jgi:hypothetical protein
MFIKNRWSENESSPTLFGISDPSVGACPKE